MIKSNQHTELVLEGGGLRGVFTCGGPFGAVIVRDGEVISTGANRVVPNSDQTAHADAKAINFYDSFIYDQLELKYEDRSIKCEHFMRSDALRAFKKWNDKEDKIEY